MEKAVISARVPVKLKTDLTNYCKGNGTTVSEYIQSMFENVDRDTFLRKADATVVDNETRGTLLALGGGSAIAILVYKGVMALLTDKYPLMDETEAKALSVGAAGVVGILGGIGIHKLIN